MRKQSQDIKKLEKYNISFTKKLQQCQNVNNDNLSLMSL